MKRLMTATVIVLLLAGTCIAQDVISEPDIDGDAVAVLGDPAARQALEQECIAQVVADTPYPEFYRAVRILAIIGSDACVEPLAALLSNPEKAHLVRNVLESMDSENVDEALCDALETTVGKQRLGVIASIQARRSVKAVDILTSLLADNDLETVSAAANALGAIASPKAVKALESLLERSDEAARLAGAEALLRAARQVQGKTGAAIYTKLADAALPDFIQTGAFTGLLEAEPEKALDRVIQAIQGDNSLLQLTAIAALATLDDAAVAQKLSPLLPELPGNLQALVINALAERTEPAVLPLVHAVLESNSEEARLAAMRAIAVRGNVTSIGPLYAVIERTENRQERMAAMETLRRLHGKDVDNVLIDRMKSAPEAIRGDLMAVLAQRNVVSAVDAIIEQVQYDALRASAFRALTHIVEEERIEQLFSLLAGLKDDLGRPEAESALVALLKRIAEQGKELAPLLESKLKTADSNAEQLSLLRVISRLGGDDLYQLMLPWLENDNAEIFDGAVRALANWPEVTAAAKLAALFAQAEDTSHRMITLRGCVRLLRLGEMDVATTLSIYEQLINAANNADERKVILAGLAEVNSPDAIPLVLAMIEDESIMAEADMAMKRIGDATGMSEAEIQKTKESVASEKDSDDKDGFVAIFDGNSLDGWAGEPSLWRVEDGCIIGESTDKNPVKVNTFLVWEGGDVANFELKFRYKLESEWANSGVQIRSERFEGYRVRGYQADIASEDWIPGICYEEGGRGILARRGQKVELGPGDAKKITQFADEEELGAYIKMDDWNDYHIIAQSNQFSSSINGHKTHEVIDNSPQAKASGVLAFQLHAGPPMKIRITDVMLKQLPDGK